MLGKQSFGLYCNVVWNTSTTSSWVYFFSSIILVIVVVFEKLYVLKYNSFCEIQTKNKNRMMNNICEASKVIS